MMHKIPYVSKAEALEFISCRFESALQAQAVAANINARANGTGVAVTRGNEIEWVSAHNALPSQTNLAEWGGDTSEEYDRKLGIRW